MLRIAALLGLTTLGLTAAQPAEPVPTSSRRPFEVLRAPGLARSGPIDATLPPGFTIEVVAETPLVTHPIMACVGPNRSLFVGDAVGVNWNKAQLEASPPNRILRLQDLDGDGRYDRSTVFADGLTFPQGALWHAGSLYVCSPPGLLRLTDADGDGVAERREVLVSGFDYTGNAADVHGPFLGPRNRLYFCHGRKGHRATDRDGRVVHEGQAAGVWRCDLEGRELEWVMLGAGDNPVEVAFGPWDEAFVTYNLYHSQPRGDAVIHLQEGAVHPRGDLPQVTAAEPRTIARHPVLHDFGHVAVSGATLWQRSNGFDAGGSPLQMMVTHFNTGRMVRLELRESGAGWTAREHEFLRLRQADTHLTDVLEDTDGSLLVVDTGGWFRLGCPSSLLARPEALGRIYRIRPAKPMEIGAGWLTVRIDDGNIGNDLMYGEPNVVRQACERLAWENPRGNFAVDIDEGARRALENLLGRPLEPEAEHALLRALQLRGVFADAPLTYDLPVGLTRRLSVPPTLSKDGSTDKADAQSKQHVDTSEAALANRFRRLLIVRAPVPGRASPEVLAAATAHVASPDQALAATAREIVLARTEPPPALPPLIATWLREPTPKTAQLAATTALARGFLRHPAARGWVTTLLTHKAETAQAAAIEILAGQNAGVREDAWVAPLRARLLGRRDARTFEAVRRLREPRLDDALAGIVADRGRPMSERLRALEAMTKRPDSEAAFDLAVKALSDTSLTARLQAARFLGASSPTAAQAAELTRALAGLGALELRELVAVTRRLPATAVTDFARALAAQPALAGLQESVLRTHFQPHPAEAFELHLRPALRALGDADEARHYRLETVARLAADGDTDRGRRLFATGRGACVGCHQVGELGRRLGPDLTAIGRIRGTRDLAESILFPSRTLARDHETHAIELRDGRVIQGIIRSHVAEGLLLVDAGGQETLVPHAEIAADTTLSESLMPAGLDAGLSDQELADLIAWLRSLR